jgi:predicted phage terminase large subunit-like protein
MLRLQKGATIKMQSLLSDCPVPRERACTLASLLRDDLARKHGRARRAQYGSRGSFDLLAWGRKYLPEHFSRPPSNMHRWLAEQLGEMRSVRGTKVNMLGPRGGAKSTIGTLAFPLWAAVECWEPYIWIVSDTKHQACAHLENIKAELLHNPRLAADFPQAVGQGLVWRSNAIVLRNGVAVEAFGTGQRIRGRRYRFHRPTLIVCDDLQNDGHMQSALQREHSRAWFDGALLKAGTARTNILNLATALHREALAMELHRRPGWTSRLFQAIQRWPDHMSLWQAWEALYTDLANPHRKQAARAFYEQHGQAMDLGAILLWPEEENLYTLMCMRAESGRTAFEREKQNSPINPDLCEWPESYFDESIWFDAWPKQLVVKTMALDPSKGSDARRGDFSALVMLGVDRQGLVYLEADLARRPTPQIVADGVELYRKFQPHVFGIEANQFQDLLAGEFEAEFRRQGLLAARPWPIDNHTNKLVRIRRLGPYLSSRRLRFKSDSPGTRLLVEQMQQFPIGDHDDGPDAAEMAIRLAAELLEGRAASDGLGNRLPVG